MNTPALAIAKTLDGEDIVRRVVATDESVGLTIGRIALGLVMFAHAAQKAFGWFGGSGFESTLLFMHDKLAIPMPLAALAVLCELFGSLMLIAGAFARIGALFIGTIMLVAALLVHAPNGFFMNWFGQQAGEGFEYHVLALALALVTIACGAGRWSADRWMAKQLGQ